MFRSIATASLLVLLAACATSPQHQATTATNTSCLATGSRIPLSPGDCAAFGRSYSDEELRQTGQVDVGPALRMLDPTITVQH
jgi:hypothetical protein